ncbi:MAG: hypothetical protein DRH33_02400 [Candidatus Nealsonbacteria bacterium]|nr:MAG: hypothetical protein DRH33_02400 [Candidatus Nealsonbacteria bacterium]
METFESKIKRLYKFFILFFVISVFVLNWHELSWVFDYRFLYSRAVDFIQCKRENLRESLIGDSTKKEEIFYKEGVIEIPKIKVNAPIIFTEDEEKDTLIKALERGVVHFYDSPDPGEPGKTIILGHSAPIGWPDKNYESVFTHLNDLNKGDEINIYFRGQKFNYKVTKKYFVDPGYEIASTVENGKSLVALVSCWPPGKLQKRIIIEATLDR